MLAESIFRQPDKACFQRQCYLQIFFLSLLSQIMSEKTLTWVTVKLLFMN